MKHSKLLEIQGVLVTANHSDLAELLVKANYDSVMKLNDTMAIMRCLQLIRNTKIPKKEDQQKEASICRYKLAEYYFDKLKKSINKNKKVNQDEFEFRKKDLEKASKFMFKVGRITSEKLVSVIKGSKKEQKIS